MCCSQTERNAGCIFIKEALCLLSYNWPLRLPRHSRWRLFLQLFMRPCTGKHTWKTRALQNFAKDHYSVTKHNWLFKKKKNLTSDQSPTSRKLYFHKKHLECSSCCLWAGLLFLVLDLNYVHFLVKVSNNSAPLDWSVCFEHWTVSVGWIPQWHQLITLSN